MKQLTKDETKLIMGGRSAPGCTATAACSNGSSVSISGTGAGSNCTGTDYVNASNGVGVVCFHPASGSGNSTCNYC